MWNTIIGFVCAMYYYYSLGNKSEQCNSLVKEIYYGSGSI